MAHVGDLVDPSVEETLPILPGAVADPAEFPGQHLQHSKWARFKAKWQEFWTKCNACCGVTMGGLYGACACCCEGIMTAIGCFGGCASLKIWCSQQCPLSRVWFLRKKALAQFLDSVATANIMGVLSLNILCVTFFLKWAPEDSVCISKGFNSWAKVIVSGLPFALFPFTLYVAGQAKALQHDLHGIGLVAGAVLFEVVYILCMGGLMTVCMSSSGWRPVSVVTVLLSLLLLLSWGCCCFVPKCLRSCSVCMWGWMCCEVIDEDEEPDLEA